MKTHTYIRLVVATLAALLGLIAAALPAQAGRDDVIEVDKFNETFEEPFAAMDFEQICGVDNLQAIITVKGRAVIYENGVDAHVNFELVWTDLDNGNRLQVSWAENTEIRGTVEIVDGVETIDETQVTRGLWEKWQAPGHGVIVRDAGQVTFDRMIMFDAETGEFLGFEEAFATKGPHPLIEAGGPFPTYGDAICGALGGQFTPPPEPPV